MLGLPRLFARARARVCVCVCVCARFTLCEVLRQMDTNGDGVCHPGRAMLFCSLAC